MWYGEMYVILVAITKQLENQDYGAAKQNLKTITERLMKEGLVINAKLEEGGDDDYKAINQK